jgi:hypothetical protein
MPPTKAELHFAKDSYNCTKLVWRSAAIISILLAIICSLPYNHCVKNTSRYNGSCIDAQCQLVSKTTFVNNTNCAFTYKLQYEIVNYHGPEISDLKIVDTCNKTVESSIPCIIKVSNNQAVISDKLIINCKIKKDNRICPGEFAAQMIFILVALLVCLFSFAIFIGGRNKDPPVPLPERSIELYYEELRKSNANQN